MSDHIGLVAGEGALPAILARAMCAKGLEIVAIALCQQAYACLHPLVQHLHNLGVGQGNKIIGILKDEGVREVVIIGKVHKEVLFHRWRLDSRALRVLRRAKSFRDDALLTEVIREFESEGLRVVEPCHFIPELCPKGGVLTRRRPTRREWQDIEYGFTAARSIGKLGIGQTVVVKSGVVLAVEGMEGTDEAIARGSRLGQEGAVVVKVSRPGQDLRLDMPTVGMRTLEVMRAGKATVLAIEAGKTLVVDGEAFVRAADDAGISAVAG